MFYLTACSLIWAFSYGLIKNNLVGLSPDLIAWFRMVIPAILFIPFFSRKNLSITSFFAFLGIGSIQYGIMYLLVIRAYSYLPAYQVVLFTASIPIYVTLIHDLLRKSFHPFHFGTALLALFGAACIYVQELEWNTTLKGFLLVQLSDICFAFGQVAYKHLRQKQPKLKDQNLYALLFCGGLIVTTLSTSVFHGWASMSLITGKQLYLLLYLGAIASGLCFFWWNKAAVTTHIGTLAVLNNMKAPAGILVSLLFFQEHANYPKLLLSFSLIFTALILSEWYNQKTKKEIKPRLI